VLVPTGGTGLLPRLKDGEAPRVAAWWCGCSTDFEASYAFVGNDGPVFYFLTDPQPPASAIAIDTRPPRAGPLARDHPAGPDVLEGVQIIHDTFVPTTCTTRRRAALFGLNGDWLKELDLPTSARSAGSAASARMTRCSTPSPRSCTPRRSSATTSRGVTSVFIARSIDFDPSGYETKQVFYTSKDGTRVPMFITHKKGRASDGANPTYLYGYGGFNISLTPGVLRACRVARDGGCVRGPEPEGRRRVGEEWHQAGDMTEAERVRRLHRRRAVPYRPGLHVHVQARHRAGPTAAPRGAAITQRPDCRGGPTRGGRAWTWLRFHKFTIGWAW